MRAAAVLREHHDAGGRRADQLIGAGAVVVGTVIAFALQLVAPVGVPLYDGVVVQEPYRYLHPTGSQPGSPTSFSSTPAVTGSESPAFVAATTEVPAQAQMISQVDAFQLTPGATALAVAITPVDPPSVAPPGPIAGNVYRVSVSDQGGTPLAIKPCEGCLTLYMRAPEGTAEARLMRFAGGEWTDVNAIHVPTTGMYSWNVTGLGDFAVVSTGSGGIGIEAIVIGGAVVVLLLGIAGALAMRRRPPTAPAARPGQRGAARGTQPGVPTGVRSRGIPSKRKAPPRRPPSGRSDR